MPRVALYRKYRSADLADVVGQEHITSTLENALQRSMISHAYLFTGPRGTGKTSVARILARRVNGLDASVANSTQLDIIEIDAASNRGIDEIRALRERLASAPSLLKYKVYIIDEAHMLTKEAANALLKSLEEPPEHVIFILATTEVHKLPETIVSRAQRFDFRPFSVDVITKRLTEIAKEENIAAEQAALLHIAELSQGGMRDAIGMLDQLGAHKTELTEAVVGDILGIATTSELEAILTAAMQRNAGGALAALEKVLQRGLAATVVLAQLQSLLRAALLDEKSQYTQLFVIESLDQLSSAMQFARGSSHPSLPLELAIAKIASSYLANSAREDSTQDSTQGSARDSKQESTQDSTKPIANSNNQNTTQSTAAIKPVQNNTKPEQPKENEGPAPSKKLDVASASAKALSIIKEHNTSLYSLLYSGGARLEGGTLVVDCRFNFHKERIEEHRNREIVEKVYSRVCKFPVELRCVLSQATPEPSEQPKPDTELVSSAMAILGGEIVDE